MSTKLENYVECIYTSNTKCIMKKVKYRKKISFFLRRSNMHLVRVSGEKEAQKSAEINEK